MESIGATLPLPLPKTHFFNGVRVSNAAINSTPPIGTTISMISSDSFSLDALLAGLDAGSEGVVSTADMDSKLMPLVSNVELLSKESASALTNASRNRVPLSAVTTLSKAAEICEKSVVVDPEDDKASSRACAVSRMMKLTMAPNEGARRRRDVPEA